MVKVDKHRLCHLSVFNNLHLYPRKKYRLTQKAASLDCIVNAPFFADSLGIPEHPFGSNFTAFFYYISLYC